MQSKMLLVALAQTSFGVAFLMEKGYASMNFFHFFIKFSNVEGTPLAVYDIFRCLIL